jgi:hypothetical protein
MKYAKRQIVLRFFAALISLLLIFNNAFTQTKDKIQKNRSDTIIMSLVQDGFSLELTFKKGSGFNHPTFTIWLEDEQGNYLRTLFVTRYFATGTYAFADKGDGHWSDQSGEAIRPAALPYWAHKRNVISRDSLYVPTPENPLPDAITGATPQNSFILLTSLGKNLPQKLRILLEINQPWDWNEFWTNDKFPGNLDYQVSAQPSVVYDGHIDLDNPDEIIKLSPIGHGHYSGKDGLLYHDLNTLTTALNIAKEISVQIIN